MGIVFLLILIMLSVLSGVLPRKHGNRGLTGFYLGVLPLGVGLLFLTIQASPSPAHGAEQVVECLLAMLALSLCVTLPVSLLVMSKPLRRSLKQGNGLWYALVAIGTAYILCGLLGVHCSFPFSELGLEVLEILVGFSFTRYELVTGIVLALFACIGITRRLGPTIPCVILGMFAVRLFLVVFVGPSGVGYEVHVAYRRAIQGDIKTLVFGAACGAVIGLVLDNRRAIKSKSPEKDKPVHEQVATTDTAGQ
jgi:hypothetical protein